jgi:signal transduction histidine kinase/CheY-like chemotaxis protein
MDELLRLVAERAVDIFSARRVAIIATVGLGRPQTCKVVAPAVSDRETAEPNVLELEWVLSAEHDRIVELRAGETYDRYLEFEGIEVSDRASGNPKLSIAPLFGRDGRKVGTMAMLVDDDPLDDCSPLFLQLAQTASIAIENTLFADAREANRLKDEFLATLSHELRTPLTAMFGWIQLLRTGDLEPAQTEQGLEVIERNITVQAKLIDDLLDISRIVSGKLRLRPAPMDLRTSVRAAVDVIRPQSEAKGLHLEVVEGDQPATVYGDADRLQQVAWNLLSNAVKFTPQDGHIRVDITESHRQVRLRISDTGQGITASFLPHVFDRFRQADSTTTRLHEGLGIGLALVEHVVHLHGGTVKAESPGENQGATFTVELPVSTDRVLDVEGTPPANDERISDSSSALRLTGLRVLVVEDQQDTREVLVRTIENYGADVLQADCAAQAIELLQMHSVDLLVSDIGLPRMDGYGLIRCLRRDPTMLSLPAIAVTAFAHDEDRQRALRAGYDAHVAKPVSGSHLARTALQLLQSRRAVDDAAAKNGTKQTSVVSGFHRQ